MRPLRPETAALLEVGVLFLPGIPALIWLWPAVRGTPYLDWVQVLVYLYVLGGTLFIGLRRWTWDQLGVSRRGVGVGFVFGSVLIVEQVLARVVLGDPLTLRPWAPVRLAGEIVFYFGLVGVGEELLFRGLIFRALENWRGPALAIVGSSIGFAVWHVGWMGIFIFAPFLLGLFWGLVRWRAGGLTGLVIVHGLYDVLAAEFAGPARSLNVGEILSLTVVNRWAAVAGDLLLLAAVLYLWKGFSSAPAPCSRPGPPSSRSSRA